VATVLNPTGNFPTEWDSTTIADVNLGFAADTEAHAVASNAKLKQLHIDGTVTDKQLAQVLRVQLRPFWDANKETIAAPVGALAAGSGSTSYYYVAVPRYPLNPGPGNGGTPAFMNFTSGTPPERRSNLPPEANATSVTGTTVQTTGNFALGLPAGRDRTARFAPPSAASTAVASAPATLTATDYITVTAPALPSGHIDSGLTFDIVATDATGLIAKYLVAAGVAPGGTCKDDGTHALQPYVLPTHAEVAKGPTSAARIDIYAVQVEDFTS
jgi:hypothetical protein